METLENTDSLQKLKVPHDELGYVKRHTLRAVKEFFNDSGVKVIGNDVNSATEAITNLKDLSMPPEMPDGDSDKIETS